MGSYKVFRSGSNPIELSRIFQPGAVLTSATDTLLTYANPSGITVLVGGDGFTRDAGGNPTGGTITSVVVSTSADPHDSGAWQSAWTDMSRPLVGFHNAWFAPGMDAGDAGAFLMSGTVGATGSNGNDILFGFADGDDFDGRNGLDLVTYEYASVGVTVDLGLGTARDASGGIDRLQRIEQVRGTAFGDRLVSADVAPEIDIFGLGFGDDPLTLVYDDIWNVVTPPTYPLIIIVTTTYPVSWEPETTRPLGTAGDQLPYLLAGLGGNDTIQGGDWRIIAQPGSGSDTVTGGSSLGDTVSYADHQGGGSAIVNLAAGIAIDPDGGTDTLSGVEGAFGGKNSDILTGSGAGDFFAGLNGNDQINGGAGLDQARYDVDAAYGGTGGVYVDLALGLALDGFGSADTLTSIEWVRGTANHFGGGADIGDVFYGSGGDDGFQGMAGVDFIDGRLGNDTASYASDGSAGGTRGIFASLADGVATDGFGDMDHLVSIENIVGTDFSNPDFIGYSDVILGSDADNVLDGRGGSDLIRGGDGNDTVLGGGGADALFGDDGTDLINGGYGDDVMTGGDGSDTFVIAALTSLPEPGDRLFTANVLSTDVILDLLPGTDFIQASAALRDGMIFGDGYLQYDYYPDKTVLGGAPTGTVLIPGVTAAEIEAALRYV